MTAADPAETTLSPEEAAALADELLRARREEAHARRVPGVDADEGGRGPRLAALRGALDRYARDETRLLASRFQRRLRLRAIGLEEVRAAELAALLRCNDRVVSFSVAGRGERGFALLSRPLFFAWLRCAFGERAGTPASPPPERPYTQIELRFLRRVAAERMERLAAAVGLPVAVGEVEDAAAALRELRGARLWLASFEVDGFDAIARLRFALPRSFLGEAPAASRRGGAAPARVGIERAVLDAPVRVTAEVGHATLPLARIASLRVGECIPLEVRRDGCVLVRVEGEPRLRGRRGSVSGRVAVQVVDRLSAEEEEELDDDVRTL